MATRKARLIQFVLLGLIEQIKLALEHAGCVIECECPDADVDAIAQAAETFRVELEKLQARRSGVDLRAELEETEEQIEAYRTGPLAPGDEEYLTRMRGYRADILATLRELP